MVSLEFMRRFYGIPRKYKMRWAVIVEENKDGEVCCRLGVLLDGTAKVVDVMKRKFIQSNLLMPVKRETYPAKKVSDGKYVQFDTVDASVCKSVRVCNRELEVEYFTAHYSPELMDTFVF